MIFRLLLQIFGIELLIVVKRVEQPPTSPVAARKQADQGDDNIASFLEYLDEVKRNK